MMNLLRFNMASEELLLEEEKDELLEDFEKSLEDLKAGRFKRVA